MGGLGLVVADPIERGPVLARALGLTLAHDLGLGGAGGGEGSREQQVVELLVGVAAGPVVGPLVICGQAFDDGLDLVPVQQVENAALALVVVCAVVVEVPE